MNGCPTRGIPIDTLRKIPSVYAIPLRHPQTAAETEQRPYLRHNSGAAAGLRKNNRESIQVVFPQCSREQKGTYRTCRVMHSALQQPGRRVDGKYASPGRRNADNNTGWEPADRHRFLQACLSATAENRSNMLFLFALLIGKAVAYHPAPHRLSGLW